MTPIERATTYFEQTVNRMQEDLKKDANRPSMNKKSISIRLQNINNLVDYFNESQSRISLLQAQFDEAQWLHQRLHANTIKLVMFCRMHNIDPDIALQFKLTELEEMQEYGIHFQPSRIDFNKVKIEDGTLKEVDSEPLNIDLDIKTAPLINKYYNLLALSFYAKKVR